MRDDCQEWWTGAPCEAQGVDHAQATTLYEDLAAHLFAGERHMPRETVRE